MKRRHGLMAFVAASAVAILVALPIVREAARERRRMWFACLETAPSGEIVARRLDSAGEPVPTYRLVWDAAGGQVSSRGAIDVDEAHKRAQLIVKAIGGSFEGPGALQYSDVEIEARCSGQTQSMKFVEPIGPASLELCVEPADERPGCIASWFRDRWMQADPSALRISAAIDASKLDLALKLE